MAARGMLASRRAGGHLRAGANLLSAREMGSAAEAGRLRLDRPTWRWLDPTELGRTKLDRTKLDWTKLNSTQLGLAGLNSTFHFGAGREPDASRLEEL